ncbi:hypothetical protein AGABI1DRAFT_131279 [Agaricus bisporus var. burnettii JB137-S8]|uniref:ABC transporter domain-containing protein n=1 Tax=Agaricus bisporus var. burnettii (strain JB137-S8 / ATCC MYA-4627 / FGSC 10392) TaxID=597362 RepID=K5X0N4_AGABU|nr:uncharacterized protein AGABI1DRAFT_131279 [Agaricus bisporus var. burnettii JB137-S8]EKM76452.1 hypothetical protein AGABI1DRAFT_131279 [Agaricus bisporus var. burnettii JB137-S8]
MAVLSRPLRYPFFKHPPQRRTLLLVFGATLLLRALPGNVFHNIFHRDKGKGKAFPADQLKQTLQQMYETDENGRVCLLVPYEGGVQKVPIPSPSDHSSDKDAFPLLSTSTQAKPNLDLAFLRQLRSIICCILFPPAKLWRNKDLGIVLMHSSFLVLRTVLSIMVARLDGRIVRDLVKSDGKGFLKGIVLWFVLAIPSTYTNSMIRHLQSVLHLHLRTRLTRYIHDLYFASYPEARYYQISLEHKLDGIDQYITADVDAWAGSLSGLYGNLLKPTLDIVLFLSQLSRSLGARGTVLLWVNYYITIRILRAVTPAFGRLAAVEARLEGEYRRGVGRVGRESEEVAFYDGGAREKDILTRAYLRLIKHVNSIYKIRIAYEWTEDYVIKYLWSAAGYGLIAVPFLFTRNKRLQSDSPSIIETREAKDNAVAGRTETYISNRRLLLSLADAGGRLMFAYKDMLELAGLTTRLYTLVSTLHNLPQSPEGKISVDDSIEIRNIDVTIPGSNDDTPPLVKDLSFIVRPGEHLMITGSNGVGKTAIARVLAGLWRPTPSSSESESDSGSGSGISLKTSGTSAVYAPQNAHDRHHPSVFVVPQRAYMVVGSLLDQVIYPHTYQEFIKSGRTIDELEDILEKVFLTYLPDREGGWTTRKEWRDVLSGGEKQRMSLARVFYHRPKFAILDECTSAVSSDVEGRMYESLKALGVTLITITLRPSLTKFHKQLLTLNLDSSSSAHWTLSRVGTAEERMEIHREIKSLEEKLADVEGWESRVKELEVLLSAGGISSSAGASSGECS